MRGIGGGERIWFFFHFLFSGCSLEVRGNGKISPLCFLSHRSTFPLSLSLSISLSLSPPANKRTNQKQNATEELERLERAFDDVKTALFRRLHGALRAEVFDDSVSEARMEGASDSISVGAAAAAGAGAASSSRSEDEDEDDEGEEAEAEPDSPHHAAAAGGNGAAAASAAAAATTTTAANGKAAAAK